MSHLNIRKSKVIIILTLFIFYSCSDKKSPSNEIISKKKITLKKIKENPFASYTIEEAVALYLENVKGEIPKPGANEKIINLSCYPVKETPIIDGKVDKVWDRAKGKYIWDQVSKKNVFIKSIYQKELKEIYFLVEFNDENRSDQHKPWVWDAKENIYKQSGIREDVFIFKWNLNINDVNLSVYSDDDYSADIWFWKANRTNPVSYADDKIQFFTKNNMKNYKAITNKNNDKRYLLRRGDQGDPAYRSNLPTVFQKKYMKRFINQTPSLSRSDIRAKGIWKKSKWSIEFKRKLITKHSDDIQFHDLSKKYLFGISCKEIAGRYPNPKLDQPLYGSGDVGSQIFLRFK